MPDMRSNEISKRIGNTTVRISEEYTVHTPCEVAAILDRIKRRAQRELVPGTNKKPDAQNA